MEPEKIKALIDYAEKMTAFIEAEIELVHEIGKSPAESGLATGPDQSAQLPNRGRCVHRRDAPVHRGPRE